MAVPPQEAFLAFGDSLVFSCPFVRESVGLILCLSYLALFMGLFVKVSDFSSSITKQIISQLATLV